MKLPVAFAVATAGMFVATCVPSPHVARSSPPPRSAQPGAPQPAQQPSASPSAIDTLVADAKWVYLNETEGRHVNAQLARIASDDVLLRALARGKFARARAEAERQMNPDREHFYHVTRVSVIRRSRVLFNATVNADGSFVVAPARCELSLAGRRLGTLLVSIQDVVGFVKIVHKFTIPGAQVVVRGASGQVRASLRAAARARLPQSGPVRIGRRAYFVSSFGETGWGSEPLTVWVLAPA